MPNMNIIIDKEMLIKELMHIRSKVEPEQEELKQSILSLIDLITHIPVETTKAQYPRISGHR